MKNFKYFIIIFLLTIAVVSCEDVLDKKPLGLISDADVWNDEALVDAYLNDIYFNTEFFNFRTNDNHTLGMISSMGGEYRVMGGWQSSYRASTGIITETGEDSHLQYWKYQNIRNANFLIEQLQGESLLDNDFKQQRTAEARFLRAYMYFEMVKRYGGVPLITEVQKLGDPEEEIFLPRNSEKEVYDFILEELDAITQVLPEVQPIGVSRPSKWAALAFKSRVMLYPASIAKYGTQQLNGLLGFPAGDVNKYAQEAYDAAKLVINESGLKLYNVLGDKTENFQNLFIDESSANTEVIMVQKFTEGEGLGHNFNNLAIPDGFATNWGSNFPIIYDFVELFEFEDGSSGQIPRNQLTSQEWAVDELFHNRDPRFKASVFYPESPWQGGKVYFHTSTLVNGEEKKSGTIEGIWPASGPGRNTNRTGFHLRKRLDESHLLPQTREDDTDLIILRLGEVYLNLAEAAYYLNNNDEALQALNTVRERAGMPLKTEIDESVIRNERAVELAFEDQRYWDLRRWRTAKEVLDGNRLKGVKYKYNWDTKKYQISLANAEGNARTFQDRHYYFPINVNRLAENPNLVENPGYE